MKKAMREVSKQDHIESIRRTQRKWERRRAGYKASLGKRADRTAVFLAQKRERLEQTKRIGLEIMHQKHKLLEAMDKMRITKNFSNSEELFGVLEAAPKKMKK